MTGTEGSGTTSNYSNLVHPFINQAAPVQNTWYTITERTNQGLFYGCAFAVAATDETLELRVTINGKALAVATQNAVAGTNYVTSQFRIVWPSTAGTLDGLYIVLAAGADVGAQLMGFGPIPYNTLKLEIRKTTVAGVGAITAAALVGE